MPQEIVVEGLTIQPVPESERTGLVRHLFSFWFTVQIIPLAVVTGLLGPVVFGLDVKSSTLAIIAGSVVGAVFMALHSAQGSALGVPQMIQARAQFGMYGSLLVTVVVILAYLGWIISLIVLAQQMLTAVFSGLSVNAGLVISTVLTLLTVVVGYKLILKANRVMVAVSALALILMLIYTCIEAADHDGSLWSAGGGFSWAGFLGMASVAGVWQLSYAPYVSDYSRYLPSSTTTKSAFWYTYLGTTIGGIGAFVLGAVLVAGLGPDGGLADLDGIMPHAIFIFVMLVMFFGAIDAAVINMYGSSLCVLTCLQTFKLSWAPRSSARNITALVMSIVVFVAATSVSDSFMADYINFILFLSYLMIPWSVINLIDFYMIHKGNYDPNSFSDPKSGYGAFNIPAVASYVLGFAIQIPFMSTALYTGPIAKEIDLIDTAWVVGTIATFFIYLGLIKLWGQGSTASGRVDQVAA